MLPETLTTPEALLAVIFIFIISLVVLHYQSKHGQHDGKKRPPGPKALPIIGNLHMLGKLPHRTLQSLAAKYGPIMSIKLGQVPTIVVSSPEAAELFLKTHDAVFGGRPKLQATDTFSYGRKGMVFTEYGGYWRNVRKVCTLQLLTASKAEMFGPMRREEMGLLVKSLEKASASGEVVDLSKVIREVGENITYQMILGQSKDDALNIKGLFDEAMSLIGAFNLADYAPFLRVFDFQGLTRRLNKTSKALDQGLEQIIKDHEHPSLNEPKGSHHQDFIDILLSLMHQPMDPQGEQKDVLERTGIKAITSDMIAGAFGTSTTAIDWAMAELLKHPRALKRLQDELESVVGMNRKVEEKDLERLHYLDMVVKEAFRLHPPGPLLVPRESLRDVTIDGYFIEKKSRIFINVWAIGRDPKVWSENVEMFYPERFENNNMDMTGHDFRLLPFGSGRRGCPGIQLGLIIIKLVLAQLVHCFSWELPIGLSPEDLDMTEEFGLSIPRSRHLLARPTYRLECKA